MKKITVLGTGLVGQAIVLELAADYEITAIDKNTDHLSRIFKSGIHTVELDVAGEPDLSRWLADQDLVINALPGPIGYESLKKCIRSGIDTVDISFFAENPFDLDELAREHHVTAVIDCGVAPGLCNVILGYHVHDIEVTDYACYVGGLPVNRVAPYEYKAPFSPIDVLEEYTRPARMKIDGKVVTKPALSEPEFLLCDPSIGTLEAFNTDGLRTLLNTVDVPNMKEKTLRYPGHRHIMHIFAHTGFFSRDEIEIKGQKIRPMDLTFRLLFPLWKLEQGENEFTLMKIEIKGKDGSGDVHYEYMLLDRYDPVSGQSSMARTTGYTCTGIARLILEKGFHRPGIVAPEQIGKHKEHVRFLLSYLAAKNLYLHKKEHHLDPGKK